ncbi:Mitochondrial dicarboxylate carrier, partial [Operophtera brumata]
MVNDKRHEALMFSKNISSIMSAKESKVSQWYFGGLASAGAACITHPLDLLKVQMQTQKGKNISMLKLTATVVKNQGKHWIINFNKLTYSTARFGIYEMAKQEMTPKDGSPIPFYISALLAGMGGFAGGFVGNPADLVNVRMQNDVNYKNAVHGLYKVAATEGLPRLWAGATMTCSRAALMTIGQLAFYDQIKELLLSTVYFGDDVITHGGIATTLTQPVDVLKTRVMNAKPGEVKSILTLVKNLAKESPLAFFKGYIPAFARLAPHTILTF